MLAPSHGPAWPLREAPAVFAIVRPGRGVETQYGVATPAPLDATTKLPTTHGPGAAELARIVVVKRALQNIAEWSYLWFARPDRIVVSRRAGRGDIAVRLGLPTIDLLLLPREAQVSPDIVGSVILGWSGEAERAI